MKRLWSKKLHRLFALLLVGAFFLQRSAVALEGVADSTQSITEQSQTEDMAQSTQQTEQETSVATDEAATEADTSAQETDAADTEQADAQETEAETETEAAQDAQEEEEETSTAVSDTSDEEASTTDSEVADAALVAEDEAEDAEAEFEGVQLGTLSTELSDDTIIVSTYAELAAALGEDNGYVYIYLAGDITQSSTDVGIAIHASKASVIIDGLAPDAQSVATFTQRASSTFAYTIRVLAANSVTRNVTMRNVTLVGQNYYGIISAEDALSGLAIRYENIIYSGPQITYNRAGSVHYSDSSIRIVSAAAAGGSVAQEVAEAAAVSFSGTVTIQSASTSNSLFWLTGSSTSFTLEAGASLNASTSYYFFYADGSYPVMNLYEGASMTYTGKYYGLLYDAQRLQSLHLYEGASLSVTQSTNTFAYGTLRIHSALTLDAGSELTVVRAAGGPAVQMVNGGASVSFADPERVKLYAPASKLIAFVSTGTLDITADAVNIWTSAGGLTNDSISNTPSYHWNKAEGQMLSISSTFSGTTQTLSSNLESSDPTDNLTSTTFAVGNAQLLVLGRFALTIDAVYASSSAITGTTEQGAALQAANLTQAIALLAEGSATGTAYSLRVASTLQSGDVLSVLSYSDYLRRLERVTVGDNQEAGTLQLTYVPQLLDFGSVQIPSAAGIIERSGTDAWYVEIEDSRSASSDWSLIVSLAAPLTATDGSTLQNALVYVDENGGQTTLSETGLLVRSGNGSETASWSQNQGVLLWGNPNEIVSNQSYSGTINWTLQDAP